MNPMPELDATTGSPYSDAAALYWAAGWRGLLPLPPGAKKPVPTGWTGREGLWPSWADVYAWSEDRHGANLGLRLPPHIIGIDVDAYNDKVGAQTLKDAEAEWGALPDTWRSTSRDDGTSGIRLYRIPEGLSWPGEVGADIEIIRWCHRYTVAWPSVHPEGRTYRWIDPAGITRIGDVPGVDDLPDLLEAWIAGLTSGEMDNGLPKANLDDPAANAWLLARGDGEPCKAMQRALDRYVDDLGHVRGSRHDAGLYGQRRIAGLAAEGHTGGLAAMGQLYAAFIDAATRPGKDQRTHDEAQAEWRRGLAGAIKLAAAQPEGDGDPCDAPFSDLITRTSTSALAVPEPLAAPHLEPAPETSNQPIARERTSWWPVDLDAALTGTNAEPEPAYLERDDGQALIYPAKVNGIIGESESGKTWIALLAAKQALADSINVTYLDFEDTSTGIVSRLLTMNTPADQIREHLAYIGPDHALDTLSSTDLAEHLDTWQPGIVIVDGVNAAMTLLGLDLISNTDATRFAQTLLRPISARGAAVLYIDHTPKSKDSDTKGGIGAQAKRAMTTGSAFKVEVIKEFGKGQDGKLRIRVDKDRPGHVRGASLPGGGGHWAGDVAINTNPDGSLDVVVSAPGEGKSAKPFRPTHLMERVSAFLATLPDGASKNTIEKEVNGNNDAKRAAVDVMVSEGYAVREKGERGAIIVRHVRLYSEVSELTSPTSPDLARPRPNDHAGSRSSDLASSPPPLQGRGEVAATLSEDENTPSSPSSPKVCRACGVIPERGTDIVVAGRCKDCRIAGREVRA
jgi:hypothetical protein